MRMVLALLAAATLVLCCSNEGAAQTVDRDRGSIESIMGDRIIVNGLRGRHELEAIGVCSWCEADLEVVITFLSSLRGTLEPDSPSREARPVKVLIIRDGREDR
jgi:hypothetical protein